MEITKDTKVSAILQQYGDIADVMEVFGVKRVGRYSLRRMITKVITVETAARVHRVPLDEFMETLNKAVLMQQQNQNAGDIPAN
jgi:virulence-associated protein VapD